MDRYFEKISFEQFKRDVCDDRSMYDEYLLPARETRCSGGYDFKAIYDITIEPGQIVKIPTGYKANFLEDEILMIVVRSSLGFKYNVRMCNQVGIIESDYYNNCSNEGHMWVSLQNEGDEVFEIKKGSSYCQGIFVKFLTCDDTVDKVRIGGIGSTDKESEINE